MTEAFPLTVALLLFSSLHAPPLLAQSSIVINEVLYDPIGTDAGNQLIEVKNIGTGTVQLTDWWFCARQSYVAIPSITIGPGEFLVVHVNATGTDTPTDVYLPFMLTMQSVSDLALYFDSNSFNPSSIVDFVQWGGVPPVGRQTEAVAAGQWAEGEFVPSVAEGHSISYDGSGNAAEDWYDDLSPTLGNENDDVATSVKDSPSRDDFFGVFRLLQNYPNPFNPSTVIEFSLPKDQFVSLRVYDIQGTQIAVLVDRRYSPGVYRLTVNAGRWSSGVYLYRLKAGKFSKTLRMLLIK